MSDSCQLPEFDQADAARLARDLFALDGSLKLLHGERDLNYRISNDAGSFVFKIANAGEDRAMLDCQHRAFERIEAAGVLPRVARARLSINGHEIEVVEDNQGQQHYCRVLPFIEGRMWSAVGTPNPALLADIGARLGGLDRALDGFSHPGLTRPLLWNMEITAVELERYTPLLASDAERALVAQFEAGYRERVLPLAGQLRRGVIHNDANRENVVVDAAGEKVISIIDFGDMIETWLVLEPAIAATYAMLDQDDPLDLGAALIGGYHRAMPLRDEEIGILFDLIGMRLSMSICLCAYQQRLQPDNEYLSIDVASSRNLLERLQPLDPADVSEMLRAACAVD